MVFINTSTVEVWKAGHIPGTVNLPLARPKDPTTKRFKEVTVAEMVDKTEEVVFYSGTIDDITQHAPYACAMALTWGFTQVYYFAGGLRAWNKAGYPVETAQ